MTKRISIADVDKVTKPGKSSGSGKTFEPTSGGTPTDDDLVPQPNIPEPKQTPKKPKPGRRTLSDDEKLDSELIERLEQELKNGNDEWNIGGLPNRPGEPGGEPGEGPGKDSPNIGDIVDPEQIPGGDTRIWVDPNQLEKEIDEANRQGEENERVQDAKDAEKEEKTDTQKTTGGKGKGRGSVRDRIAVERLSRTDWAAIFKTRLTAYSKENAKYLPWNRRFVSSKTLRPKIGSKTPEKDVLPELNILVDTSSSLSYREMAVILGEIEKAMEAAKVKTLNVFLWHHRPYAYNSWKEVTAKNFNKIVDWIQSHWEGGGNDETALYEEIVKKGKAKKFTISLTDAYLDNHMTEGKLKTAWTKALDPANTIFAIVYPNRAISYDQWLTLADRMPGQKVPVFLDTKKFS